jgi:hypothetical protein
MESRSARAVLKRGTLVLRIAMAVISSLVKEESASIHRARKSIHGM